MTTIVTVDEYIGTQAGEAQPRLRELRAIIRAAVATANGESKCSAAWRACIELRTASKP
jgi:hypothetical protein